MEFTTSSTQQKLGEKQCDITLIKKSNLELKSSSNIYVNLILQISRIYSAILVFLPLNQLYFHPYKIKFKLILREYFFLCYKVYDIIVKSFDLLIGVPTFVQFTAHCT